MAKTKVAPKDVVAVPAGLLLAEQVLGILKGVADSTPLWDSCSVKTNEMLGPTGPFSQLVLRSEQPKDEHSYLLFLAKHWAALWPTGNLTSDFFMARNVEPQWLTIRTLERLGYAEFVKAAAKALDGLPVELDEDRSWTWDMHVKTSAGKSLYHRAYELIVYFKPGAKFNAKKWLVTAMQDVCESLDERATRCPFQLAQDAGIEGMSSAEHTKTGLILEAYTTAPLKQMQTKVFGDCKTKLVEAKKNGMAVLTIEFA